MVGAPEQSKPLLLWLAPASRARDLLAASFDIRETVQGGGPCAIVASGDRANDALRLARDACATALVLIAPPAVSALDPAAAARLADIEVPVLALFGADDEASPPAFGHAWRRALKKGFQTFVFGAGADMANQRPEAIAALVADFVARGEGFLVNHADARLYDRA